VTVFLVAPGAERITRAPGDERGHPDPAELAGDVVLQESLEGRPPHPAGTFRLSRTTTSRNAAGTGRASVLSWNSRTKPGSIGSASRETSDAQNSSTTALPR
jgi:hypothetical protein